MRLERVGAVNSDVDRPKDEDIVVFKTIWALLISGIKRCTLLSVLLGVYGSLGRPKLFAVGIAWPFGRGNGICSLRHSHCIEVGCISDQISDIVMC